MTLTSADGSVFRLPGWGRLDSAKLVEALAQAGAVVKGVPKLEVIEDASDFAVVSSLTDSLNWNWQDCRTPGQAAQAKLGACSSQTVQVSQGRLSLLRKGIEVASFDLEKLTLVRQFKEVDPKSKRLLVRHGRRDLWPLTDWESEVEHRLTIALTELGLPMEERGWVRSQTTLWSTFLEPPLEG